VTVLYVFLSIGINLALKSRLLFDISATRARKKLTAQYTEKQLAGAEGAGRINWLSMADYFQHCGLSHFVDADGHVACYLPIVVSGRRNAIPVEILAP
jgi:hypothetical protein